MKRYYLNAFAALVFLFSCTQKPGSNAAVGKDSATATIKRDSTVSVIRDPVIAGTVDSTYAYIKDIVQKNDSVFIVADYIQFLTGKAALIAAEKNHEADTVRDDKGRVTDIIVDDDYYILNESKKLRTLPLAKNVLIEIVSMADGPVSSAKTSVDDFVRNHKADSFPFILKFNNNEVAEITEVYTP